MGELENRAKELDAIDKKLDAEIKAHTAEVARLKSEQETLADKQQEITRKEAKLREILAEKTRLSVDMYHRNEQDERQRARVADMEKKLSGPVEEIVPQLAQKQNVLTGAESLDPETAKLMNRIFHTGEGWHIGNRAQQFLDAVVQMEPGVRASLVANIRDLIASGHADSKDLGFDRMFRAGGLMNPRQVAGSTVDGILKQISSLPSAERKKLKKGLASDLKKKIKQLEKDDDEDAGEDEGSSDAPAAAPNPWGD